MQNNSSIKRTKDQCKTMPTNEQTKTQPQSEPDGTPAGFLGSFLSKGLKTNQLVVNTDEKTLRPIARLKEPRDLFALPKDKDNDCSQQAPRWPVECQVIEERIIHIPYVPPQPEPLNSPTGSELKPRPVGEENGIVVFNYVPISAVNYGNSSKQTKNVDSSDESDDSSDSPNESTPNSGTTPKLAQCQNKLKNSVSNLISSLDNRSTSNSQDEDNIDEDDDDTSYEFYDASGDNTEQNEAREKAMIKDLIEAKKKRYAAGKQEAGTAHRASNSRVASKDASEIEDIWQNNSNSYKSNSPRYVLSQFGKSVPKQLNDSNVDNMSAAATSTKFSRSAVGGAKFVTNCHPMCAEDYDGLEFESRFESGNLAKAVQITPTYYELYLRPDLYTSRSKQWFYFRVRRTRRNMLYRFSIVNLVKSDSLYNDGMCPVMYSNLAAKQKNEGWRRCGNNICYYRNDDDNTNTNTEEDEDNYSYTLTFTIEFSYDDDTVFFAHSYPYTYSDLQDYLMEIQRHPVKSKFCKLRLLCRTLAGNNVYYLTVTAPTANEDNARRKKSIVVSARVHPSETPASWMMKGLMDFITGDTTVAKRLRHKFIFKLVPMLNPDGVIVGNTRNSLTGKDLNRQYRTVIRETYPSIWYTKAMIRRLIEECGVAMYCDMHAHSRKHNIFIYGCENKRNPEKKLTEQVFPLMLHKNSADRFSFESCKFRIQRSKEGTGRIVVWMLGITNSYTIEASFGGSSLGSRKGTHFSTQDYEHMGRAFCETLLDYCDENPNKVKRQAKLFKQIKKIRKREKREQKALKLQKMAEQILNLLKQQEKLRSKIIERLMREGSSADEPLNIPLSDYSSDDGNCSSSSDNEGKHSLTASDLEGPCCASIRAPPSSPEVMQEIRKFRMRRLHKVMHELDRIYFTPLFQRKFKTLTRLRRRHHKTICKVPKRLAGGRFESEIYVPARSRVKTKAKIKSNLAGHKLSSSESTESSLTPSSNASEEIMQLVPPSPPQTPPKRSKTTIKATVKLAAKPISLNRKIKKKASTIKKPTKKTKIEMPVPKKVRIDRNFRLWLANRKIFIFRRKVRRTRTRSKPAKKRADVVRTTLDLPTTDPGSDLHFSTDDEEHTPQGSSTYGAVPPLRHTLLQSELQRRYIEEIGDTVVQKPKPATMPPELIVTTPSKSSKKLDAFKLTPRTAPEQDYRLIAGKSGLDVNARRTYSWHNLHQQECKQSYFSMSDAKVSAKLSKMPQRRTVPSNFKPAVQQKHGQAGTADELQLKLSLKKKIWTGSHGDGNDGRPLAPAVSQWCKGSGVPNTAAIAAATAVLRHSGGGQTNARGMYTQPNSTAKETPSAANLAAAAQASANFVGATRKSKKVEHVDLLKECTHKLLLWQQEETKKQQPTRLAGGALKLDEQDTQRGSKSALSSNKKLHNAVKGAGIALEANSMGKSKRKSSSMLKIAETTQLVTRYARTRASGSSAGATAMPPHLAQRFYYRGQASSTRLHSASGRAYNAGYMQHQQPTAGRTAPNKFKTGGLVITAVQQTSSGTNVGGVSAGQRKQRATGVTKIGGNAAAAAANIMQYRSNTACQMGRTAGGHIELDAESLVRKVKTKLKKRKSRVLNSTAAK